MSCHQKHWRLRGSSTIPVMPRILHIARCNTSPNIDIIVFQEFENFVAAFLISFHDFTFMTAYSLPLTLSSFSLSAVQDLRRLDEG